MKLDYEKIAVFAKRKKRTVMQILKHFDLNKKEYHNVIRYLKNHDIEYLTFQHDLGRKKYTLSDDAISWAKENRPTVNELFLYLKKEVSHMTVKKAMERAGISPRKKILFGE